MTASRATPGSPVGGSRSVRKGVCLLWAFLAVSCAGVSPAPPPPAPPPPAPPPPPAVEEPPPDPFGAFPGTIRNRARDAEAHREPRKALFLWRVVLGFLPEDEQAAEKVRSLSDRLKSAAEEHFREGVSAYKAGDTAAARREFLLAVANDPWHAGARDYLGNRLGEPDATTYEAKEGDTLRRVAKEKYNDADKDELIARYNDIDRNSRLAPGTRLRLPVLEPIPVATEGPEKGPKDILTYSNETDHAEAERLYRNGLRQFQAGALERAAAEWEKALRFDPAHAKARKDLDRVRRMLEKLK